MRKLRHQEFLIFPQNKKPGKFVVCIPESLLSTATRPLLSPAESKLGCPDSQDTGERQKVCEKRVM